jgi:hypothetical protein
VCGVAEPYKRLGIQPTYQFSMHKYSMQHLFNPRKHYRTTLGGTPFNLRTIILPEGDHSLNDQSLKATILQTTILRKRPILGRLIIAKLEQQGAISNCRSRIAMHVIKRSYCKIALFNGFVIETESETFKYFISRYKK